MDHTVDVHHLLTYESRSRVDGSTTALEPGDRKSINNTGVSDPVLEAMR